jgi:hypothetical protein
VCLSRPSENRKKRGEELRVLLENGKQESAGAEKPQQVRRERVKMQMS